MTTPTQTRTRYTVPTVTLTCDGGTYRVTEAALTASIARYLPANTLTLRAMVEERAGHPTDPHLSIVGLLVMLADFDHNVDHDPLSLDQWAATAPHPAVARRRDDAQVIPQHTCAVDLGPCEGCGF